MKPFIALLLAFFLTTSQAQISPWHSWEEGILQMQKQGKLGMVIIHKKDCSLTEHFIAQSIEDKVVDQFAKQYFIPIEIIHDPSKVSVDYPLLDFLQSKPKKPFAMKEVLDRKKLQSPTLFILDEKGDLLQAFAGFLEKEKLALILQYFGEGHHKTTPWKNFSAAH